MKNKYNIGDRVTGLKTGLGTPSTVVGIVTSDFFIEKLTMSDLDLWGKLYPDFKEKSVYICKFDEPTMSYSFEEMVNQIKIPLEDRKKVNGFDTFLFQIQNLEHILKCYYDLVSPKVMTVAYPEDDIVKLDEIC